MTRTCAMLTLAVGFALTEHVAGLEKDPETKNYYRADDLMRFSKAAEWTIYSLDPFPWDMDDPFAVPAPTETSAAQKPVEPSSPKRKVPPEQEFHGYPILGQTKVNVTPELKTVISTIDEAARQWTGAIAMCFSPRHGIRITVGGTSYDLLICYECSAATLFRGAEQIGGIYFVSDSRFDPQPAFLNGALIRAKVKMPPPPHH